MIVPLLVTVLAMPPAQPAPLQEKPQPAPQAATAPSLAQLPARLGHDFRRLATPAPLLTIGIGGVLAGAVHSADTRTVRSLSDSHAIETSLDAGATAGNGFTQVGLAVGVYAVGGLTHNATTARLGSALVEAQVVNGVVTQGLKFIADRRRPDGGRYSFPSGHTSATFATADVLERTFGWKVGVPAYFGAAYVGASRMAERRHYLSDVAFGAAVGIASSRCVQIRIGEHRIVPQPIAARGLAGIQVVVVPRSGS